MKATSPSFLAILIILISFSARADDPALRKKGWRPPDGTLVMPVQGSASPDGRYAIGWGYEKGPVDWSRLAYNEGEGSEWGEVTFSTKLADIPEGDPLEEDANFLLDLKSGKTLGKLGIYYPGERPRFNHDGLIASWSPALACVVIRVTQKWETEFAAIAWIRDGKCEGSHDLREPLIAAMREAVAKSPHPAARRLAAEDDFMYSLDEITIRDDGSFLAELGGVVPKLDQPEGYFEVKLEGLFSPGEAGGSAGLKTTKVEVILPAE
jgi:hypothetical protein